MDEQERSYIAFISYRHMQLDREAAMRIQKRIENYIVPKEFREKAGGKKLGLCFRDEDELPASSSLTDSIYYALDHAKFLIVICTPDLPQSKWCEAEIRYFLKTHDRDHILAVLTDGDPQESFSPYLLHEYDEEGNIVSDTEPLAANIAGKDHKINKSAFKKEIVRLYAAMIGCPFDSLWQRQKKARTNRVLAAGGAALAVMTVFLGVVLNRNAKIEEQNAQITEQNDRISEQYDQIVDQNEKIEVQNTQLQKHLSTVLVESGENKLKEHNMKGAIEDGLSAVENEDPNVYDPSARKLLSDALGAYTKNAIRTGLIYEQNLDITEMTLSDDGRLCFLADVSGVIRCLDHESATVVWEVRTDDTNPHLYTKNLGDRLIYKCGKSLCCCSMTDGSLLWSYEHTDYCGNYVQGISEDGSRFALIDKDNYTDNPIYAVVIDTADGSVLNRIDLYDPEYKFNFYDMENKMSAAVSFSEDNKKLAVLLPATKAEDNESVSLLFAADLETGERTEVCNIQGAWFYFGVHIDNTADTVFAAVYSARSGGIRTVLCKKDGEEYSLTDYCATTAVSMKGGNDYFELQKELDHRQFTMLINEYYAILTCDNFFYVYRYNESPILCRSWAITDKIINATWVDEQNNTLQLVTKDGWYLQYVLASPEEEGLILSLKGVQSDQTNEKLSLDINEGILSDQETGMCLVVNAEEPGQLLKTSHVTDPHYQSISPDIEDFRALKKILYIPETKSAIILYNGKNALTLNLETGEILAQCEFEEYFGDEMIALDEYSFLAADTLYTEKLFNIKDGTAKTISEPVLLNNWLEEYPNRIVRLNDGRILSYGSLFLPVSFSESDHNVYPVWIDHQAQEYMKDPNQVIAVVYDDDDKQKPVDRAGACGLLMVFGKPGSITEDTGENTAVFSFQDVDTGQITRMDNPYPDSGSVHVAMAHKERMMAVFYDDGHVCLMEPDSQSIKELPVYYGTNEILIMSFSDDDSYLMVVTLTGRLDIIDPGTGEVLFSEKIESFEDQARVHEQFIDYLEGTVIPDEDTLMVSLGYDTDMSTVLLDDNIWAAIADLPGAFPFYDIEERKFYLWGDGEILTCPLYDLGDLKEWANETLNQ